MHIRISISPQLRPSRVPAEEVEASEGKAVVQVARAVEEGTVLTGAAVLGAELMAVVARGVVWLEGVVQVADATEQATEGVGEVASVAGSVAKEREVKAWAATTWVPLAVSPLLVPLQA